MVRRCAFVLAILAAVATQGAAVRQNFAAQVDILSTQVQQTNSSAFFCPAICVPCAYGDKTIFISRSKGMVKKVLDIGVVALAASGIGTLWGLVAGAVGLGSYAAADHYVAHQLADECPSFELRYFQGEEYLVAPADVHQLLEDEDKSPMYLWKKSLSKLYKAEKQESRRYGQLPPSLKAMLDNADFMCGDHGGAVHVRMKEQGTVNGMFNWLTGAFESNCETLHKEYHAVTQELEKMDEPTEEVTEIDDDDNGNGGGISSGGEDINNDNTPINRVEDIQEDDTDEPVVTPEPTPEPAKIDNKPTDKDGKKNPKLVVEKEEGNDEEDMDPEEIEETFLLDGEDGDTLDNIEKIKNNRYNLITAANGPSNLCRLMKVGAFGCKLVRTDGICQCKYLAAQTCETWFPHGATLRPIMAGRGMLLMPKSLCQCYGTSRSTYGCSFGVLDHVPNVAIAE